METVAEPDTTDVDPAQALVPRMWLQHWVDEEAMCAFQSPGTTVRLEAEVFILSGTEVLLKRDWFREAFRANAKTTVIRGVVLEGDDITVVGERRAGQRSNPPLLIMRLRKSPR
jgi:hypothetical protein